MKSNNKGLDIPIILSLVFVAVIVLGSILWPSGDMKEKIKLTTSDNVEIIADLYSVANPKGWVVFAHMMPSTKESWSNLAEKLQKLGYESLAIDLRGHGQSEGGSLGYQSFSDKEHQASINDLITAWDFLRGQGANPEKTALVGASIGANLSIQFVSENSNFKKAILLSSGLNYRGIRALPLIKKLISGQRLLFVTSKDDNNNYLENQQLVDVVPEGVDKRLIVYENAGHGTNMLNNKEGLSLEEVIKEFLAN